MGNTNKIALTKVAKMSNLMDLDSKYIQAISNINFDATKNLKLTGIKNYLRLASQIEKKVNTLYKDWILVLATFVKHLYKTYNNEKVTKNIKI